LSECLFCKIAAKELDSDVLYESETMLAFRDINPVAPTHVLLIPKRHIASADELGRADGELLGDVFETIASLAAREGLGGGYRVVTNVGRDGGQAVDHLHFHLMGGRHMSWPPG
jgi:histidine triad (HIT) family protein